jgi:hypothetical protein
MAINYVKHIQILINKLQTMTLIFHFISSGIISARQQAFFEKFVQNIPAHVQEAKGKIIAINLFL